MCEKEKEVCDEMDKFIDRLSCLWQLPRYILEGNFQVSEEYGDYIAQVLK